MVIKKNDLRKELIEKLNYLNDDEIKEIEKAIDYASLKHDGQLRKTGEDYIIHPLYVAIILTSIKADKDTKSLTLVPISFDNSIENKELEPQSIGNLPIVFETSEYGKVVIEDIKITDTEIKYTYYKDGVVPGYLTLWFYDEEGDEIDISSSVKESLDRHTGRYTTILKLEGYENDISKIRKIKKVSTFSHSDMKLLYDQQIKIDLKE